MNSRSSFWTYIHTVCIVIITSMWTYFLKVVEKVRSYACNYNMGKKRASGADVSLLSHVILIHDCHQFFYSPTHLPEEDMPPSEQQLLYKCFCHRYRKRYRHKENYPKALCWILWLSGKANTNFHVYYIALWRGGCSKWTGHICWIFWYYHTAYTHQDAEINQIFICYAWWMTNFHQVLQFYQMNYEVSVLGSM